jgi:DMSO/TMAO reductase YedYZ molybdopterin-dependent catalytic subunit
MTGYNQQLGEGKMHRRELLLSGAVARAALFSERAFAQAAGGKVIPGSDQPASVPPQVENVIKGLTRWEDLDTQITPNNRFYSIAHYNRPQIDAKTWRLDIAGLVDHPIPLTLDRLKAMPREEVTFTLECLGNNGLPFFQSGWAMRAGEGHLSPRCSRQRNSRMMRLK